MRAVMPGRGAHAATGLARRSMRRRPTQWTAGALAAIAVGVVAACTLAQPAGPARQAPDLTSPAGRAAPAASPEVAPAYVFPVAGKATYDRSHHDYPAADIIAACGATVRSVHPGVVLEVSRTDTYHPNSDDGAARGGLYVSVLGDDGVRYYGSHLSRVAPGLDAGVRVRVGQVIGAVGDTGHAGVCHLHFGISPPCARVGDWWVRRGVLAPWPFLDSWRAGRSESPAEAVRAWSRAHGCPGAP